jgi:hypothetical protein
MHVSVIKPQENKWAYESRRIVSDLTSNVILCYYFRQAENSAEKLSAQAGN